MTTTRLTEDDYFHLELVKGFRLNVPNGINLYFGIGLINIKEPFIVVSNIRNMFVPLKDFYLSIADNPKVILGEPVDFTEAELDAVKLLVYSNKELLLEFWNSEYFDGTELLERLSKI